MYMDMEKAFSHIRDDRGHDLAVIALRNLGIVNGHDLSANHSFALVTCLPVTRRVTCLTPLLVCFEKSHGTTCCEPLSTHAAYLPRWIKFFLPQYMPESSRPAL